LRRYIIIKLNGVTAHAGEPEKGINPALVASIINQFDYYSARFQMKRRTKNAQRLIALSVTV
jgi:metal-dependent amidase/aminoacylase/carboxypeptidase family protein